MNIYVKIAVLIMTGVILAALPAHAQITADVSIEGALGVAGNIKSEGTVESTYFVGSGARLTEIITSITSAGAASPLTGEVTLEAEGPLYLTQSGNFITISDRASIESRTVSFLYPFSAPNGTSEAHLRLPFNATITSVEVYCLGGTSVAGEVYNSTAAAAVGSATANAGVWGVAASLTTPTYSAYDSLRFHVTAVSGTVRSASIAIHYKRR